MTYVLTILSYTDLSITNKSDRYNLYTYATVSIWTEQRVIVYVELSYKAPITICQLLRCKTSLKINMPRINEVCIFEHPYCAHKNVVGTTIRFFDYRFIKIQCVYRICHTNSSIV